MLLQHVSCQRFLRINCRPTATATAVAAAAIRYCRCGCGFGAGVAAATRLLAAVCQQHTASAYPLTKLWPHTLCGAALKTNTKSTLKKSLQNLNKQTTTTTIVGPTTQAYFASNTIDVQHDFVGVQHAHAQQPQLYQIAAATTAAYSHS